MNETPSIADRWWLIALFGAGCLALGVITLAWR
jgi:hypothetical protein